MNKILLVLGLTIIYYIVLFTWDKRRRAAFKKSQQQVIGKTTAQPVLPENEIIPVLETTPVFGNTVDFKNLATSSSETSLLEQTIADDSEDALLENLEEMVIDLEAEQTFETPKDNLIGELAASTNDIIEEEDLSNIIAKISTNKS